jgi:hypothetical protein
MTWPVRMFQLVSEPAEPGLCCRKDGLTLAGVPLLLKGEQGFAPRPQLELQRLLDAAYGPDSADAQAYVPGLQSVSRALNNGDLALATIASLLLKLPDVDADGADRLAYVEAVLKFNPNWPTQPRHAGQWATEGTGFVPVQYAGPMAGQPIPGTLGAPNPNRPKDDDYLFPPTTGAAQSANDNAQTSAQARTSDRVQYCPDPGPDVPHGASDRAKEYQSQITGLPPGEAVTFNGVTFDGCRESDGTFLEAKGQNLAWMLGRSESWFVATSSLYKDAKDQGLKQSLAAGWHHIEWYFAERSLAVYFKKKFRDWGYNNIKVCYQEFGSEISDCVLDDKPRLLYPVPES